jgi:hypothetical protein
VRAFGLRRGRYRGLARTRLQHAATAAAVDLERLAAWFRAAPRAATRTSRFAGLATARADFANGIRRFFGAKRFRDVVGGIRSDTEPRHPGGSFAGASAWRHQVWAVPDVRRAIISEPRMMVP